MKNITFMLIFLVISCGKLPEFKLKSSQTTQNVSPIYGSDKLVIKVFYEPGAEPYTDQAGLLKSWDLLQKNLDALFEGRTNRPQVIVPKALSEMTQMESFSKPTWTVDEVMNLSKTHEVTSPAGTTTFTIYFLNGLHKDNSSTIGFHISNTKVMAIFKDVIKSSGSSAQPVVPKYVEQATLVHEMGHALGLVNNGLPMLSSHQDTAHGAHCSNPDCVMYYSNEGATSMRNFATQALEKLSVVMFDQQCLTDAQNYQK